MHPDLDALRRQFGLPSSVTAAPGLRAQAGAVPRLGAVAFAGTARYPLSGNQRLGLAGALVVAGIVAGLHHVMVSLFASHVGDWTGAELAVRTLTWPGLLVQQVAAGLGAALLLVGAVRSRGWSAVDGPSGWVTVVGALAAVAGCAGTVIVAAAYVAVGVIFIVLAFAVVALFFALIAGS